MSLRGNTQNLILLAGARQYGHVFDRPDGQRFDYGLPCLNCGKVLGDLCEHAMADVKAGRAIKRCGEPDASPPTEGH